MKPITRKGLGKYHLYGSLFFTIPLSIITGLFVEVLPNLQLIGWIMVLLWFGVVGCHFLSKIPNRAIVIIDLIIYGLFIIIDVGLISVLTNQWALIKIFTPIFLILGLFAIYLGFGIYFSIMLLKIKTNIEHPIISRKEAIRVGFTFILVVGIAFSGIIGLLLLRNANLVTKNATYRSTNQESHDAIDALYHHVDRTVNGTTWHYVDEGNVTGIVILFLHGLPECWYSWRYILPLINQSYRFIVLDMKGYGRSNPTQTSFDWKVISQEIVDLMSDLGIDQYYVVGHDWGSIIGNMLMIDYPDHILGFVRMEAPIRTETIDMTNNPQFILFQSARLGTIFLQDAEWFIETVYESRMLKPLTSDDKMYLTFEFSRPGVAEAIPKYFSTQNLQYIPDLFGRLCNQIWPFPILLLQADQDPAQPLSYFTDLEIYCPHLQLKWITNASHFTNFDQPEQVATAINMFLQEN